MSIHDTKAGYGWPSILFHWAGAGLVIALYLIGQQLDGPSRGPEQTETLALHVSIGAIAVVVLGARILWRMIQRSPAPPADPRPIQLLAQIVKWGLLAMITTLVVTGPIMQWSTGQPIDVFGAVNIPSPLPEMRGLGEALEEIHEFASHAIIPLLALHVLGALKHLIFNRDGVFQRILWEKEGRTETNLEREPGGTV